MNGWESSKMVSKFDFLELKKNGIFARFTQGKEEGKHNVVEIVSYLSCLCIVNDWNDKTELTPFNLSTCPNSSVENATLLWFDIVAPSHESEKRFRISLQIEPNEIKKKLIIINHSANKQPTRLIRFHELQT